MEDGTPQLFEWLDPAFVAVDDLSTSQGVGWAALSNGSEQDSSIMPLILTGTSTEPSKHSAQCEGVHLSDLEREVDRESSIPVEQLRNETLWPELQLDRFRQEGTNPIPCQSIQDHVEENSYTDGHMLDSQSEWNNNTTHSAARSPLPKRKRGRPRIYFPMDEENNIDDLGDHNSSPRSSHLEKNRRAAEKSRQRRRVHTAGLTSRVADLSSKNESLKEREAVLREQVLALRNDLLCHARCKSGAIDRYIERRADVVSCVEALPKHGQSRRDSKQA